MAKKQRPKKPSLGSADYDVGYGRPPKDKQWKPGFCPNPSGRPRHIKSMEEYIFDEFARKVTITTSDKADITSSKKELVEVRQALAKRYVEKLLKNADLRHYKDAFRIDAENIVKLEALRDQTVSPVHEMHRLLAYITFPHTEQMTDQQIDEFLYPDGEYSFLPK